MNSEFSSFFLTRIFLVSRLKLFLPGNEITKAQHRIAAVGGILLATVHNMIRRPEVRAFLLVFALLFIVPVASFSRSSPSFGVHNEPRQRRRQQQRSCLHFCLSLQEFYQACVDQYYFPTQSMLGATSAMLGDAIAQITTTKSTQGGHGDIGTARRTDCGTNYDLNRGMAYFCKGLGGGIVWAAWFDFADVWTNECTQAMISKLSATTMWNQPSSVAPSSLDVLQQTTQTTLSILSEQFMVCPLLYGLWDIPLTTLLLGSPPRQVPIQIQEKLGPLLVNNAKVWTVVNIVTYNIPVEFRVLFSSAADVLWQVINAKITSQEIEMIPPLPALPVTYNADIADASLHRYGETITASVLPGVAFNSSGTVVTILE
jgi:hypothetical protein